MNKDEARFSTSSEAIVAYLLWNSVYPSKFAELSNIPALLYYVDKDYGNIMRKYWKGLSIPLVEYGECLVISKRMFKYMEIDNDWFTEMWDEIYDIRSDYRNKGQLTLEGDS